MKFCERFQSKLACDGTKLFTLDELETASELSSLSQVPLVETRVNKLVKDIAKQKQLFQFPVVAYVAVEDDEEPEYHLVSGRHRIAAIAEIVRNWGETASGTWTQVVTEAQRETGALSFVEGIVEVLLIECADKRTLGELVLTYNGSRSMTAAESSLTNIESGSASKRCKFQTGLATDLHVSVPSLSFQSCFTVASKLIGVKRLCKETGEHTYTGMPYLEAASDDAVAEVVVQFTHWFAIASEAGTLPSNMARNVVSIVAQFFDWSKSTLTEDQTQTVWDYLTHLLETSSVKPGKTKGKGSKVSDLVAALEEAQRQIAELKASQGM